LPVRIIYFDATLINDKKVKLQWDIADPEEADLFIIEKLNSFNNWVGLVSVSPLANVHHYESFDHAPATGENVYRLRVIAKNNNSIYSAQKKVAIRFDHSFTVYPNPASDKIIIKGKIDPNAIIRITDISGREIKRIITNTSLFSTDILLPQMEAGIYLPHLVTCVPIYCISPING
jgi:hypothetical protein